MGLFVVTQVKTNMEEFCAECSGDSKVLTEHISSEADVIERSKTESVQLGEVPGAILPQKIPEECMKEVQ